MQARRNAPAAAHARAQGRGECQEPPVPFGQGDPPLSGTAAEGGRARLTTARGEPGPPSTQGRLDRDALAVDAGLRQFNGTRRCGGGARRRARPRHTNVGRSSSKSWGCTSSCRAPAGTRSAAAGEIHRPEHGRCRLDRRRRRAGRAGVHATVRRAARRARVGEGVERRGYTLGDVDVMPKQEQAATRRRRTSCRPRHSPTSRSRSTAAPTARAARCPKRLAYVRGSGAARRHGRRGAGAGRAVRPPHPGAAGVHVDGRHRHVQGPGAAGWRTRAHVLRRRSSRCTAPRSRTTDGRAARPHRRRHRRGRPGGPPAARST